MLKIYPKTASMKILLSREARFIKLMVTGRGGERRPGGWKEHPIPPLFYSQNPGVAGDKEVSHKF